MYKSATTLLAKHNIFLQMGGDHIQSGARLRAGGCMGACFAAQEPDMNGRGFITIGVHELERK
jgi:hypothetical protein